MNTSWTKIIAAAVLLTASVSWGADDATDTSNDSGDRAPAAITASVGELGADAVKYSINSDNSEPLVVIYSAQTFVIRE